MRYLALSFVSLFTLSSCGPSASSGAAQSVGTKTAEAPATGPLLWRVQSKAGKESFVLAVGVASSAQLTDEVWTRFAKSSRLFLEFDPGQYVTALSGMNYALQEKLGPDDWKRLLYLAHPFPLEILGKIAPGFVRGFVGSVATARGRGIAEELIYRAKKRKMPLSFVEPDLAAYIKAGLDDRDLGRLREVLADPEAARRRNLELRRAYVAGEADALRPESYMPAWRAKRLEAYGRSWATTLGPEFERGDAFVALGVSELVAGQGFLATLKKNGFRVTRAAPGTPAATWEPVPQYLKRKECLAVFTKIANFTPELQKLNLNPEQISKLLNELKEGRQFLAICLRQTTPFADCVSDASSQSELSDCDRKHPLPTDE